VPAPLYRPPGSRDGLAVLGADDGACAFHEDCGERRCVIHRHLGHDALPLACRQFPRIVVIDPRGVSITLSHFCPTAAGMLSSAPPTRVLVNAPGFPRDGEYVGLDVREGLPPALRPDMLMTWDAWWQFEELAVARLTAAPDPAVALATLRAVVERLRAWAPGGEPLDTALAVAFADTRPAPIERRLPTFDDAVDLLCAAVPATYRAAARVALARRTTPPATDVHARLLAAHAFASWTAHLGEGLRTWLRAIETAHVLVAAGVSIRDVDLVLRHLADPHALARAWRSAET
jgi:hypothetical protein